jgi:hypothetical protein
MTLSVITISLISIGRIRGQEPTASPAPSPSAANAEKVKNDAASPTQKAEKSIYQNLSYWL